MSIEEECFARTTPNFEKLVLYGFQKENDEYTYSKTLKNQHFQAEIKISLSGKITGTVFDLDMESEYTLFRVENNMGAFAGEIKEEYLEVLKDIKDHCFTKNLFLFPQSNRIATFIWNTYHIKPQFLWAKYPGYGVFKKDEKWFGIIMNLKNTKEKKEIEILNVKVEEKYVPTLLKQKGYMEAYHMNKKNWISILLNDTLKDDEIIPFIKESYKFTGKQNAWIIPANPKYYDIISEFKKTDTMYWHETKGMKEKDIVFIYVTKPYQCIMYQCEIIKTGFPHHETDHPMKPQMCLRLLKTYEKEKYTIAFLQKNGIKSIRSARTIPENLKREMK